MELVISCKTTQFSNLQVMIYHLFDDTFMHVVIIPDKNYLKGSSFIFYNLEEDNTVPEKLGIFLPYDAEKLKNDYFNIQPEVVATFDANIRISKWRTLKRRKIKLTKLINGTNH